MINPKDVSRSQYFLVESNISCGCSRFCGSIEGMLPIPPPRPTTTSTPSSSNSTFGRAGNLTLSHDSNGENDDGCNLKMTNIAVKTRKEVSEGTASSATPLSKRVYSESSDQEMDIWIQVLTRLHQKLKDQSEFCSWPCHPPTGPDTRRSLSR